MPELLSLILQLNTKIAKHSPKTKIGIEKKTNPYYHEIF